MTETKPSAEKEIIEENIALIENIYKNFEALEQTLEILKLDEPLFITNVAKKAFANSVYNNFKDKKLYKNKFNN